MTKTKQKMAADYIFTVRKFAKANVILREIVQKHTLQAKIN